MKEQDVKKMIDESIKDAPQNQSVGIHIHNGSDAPVLDPVNFLGFPVLTFATTTARDNFFTSNPGLKIRNGILKLVVENATPSYRLYFFIVDAANPSGKWHYIALST